MKKMKESSNSSTNSSRLNDSETGVASGANGAGLEFQENKWVSWSKALVILVIVVATIVVAIATFRLTAKGEQHNFEVRVSTVALDIGPYRKNVTDEAFYFSLRITLIRSLKSLLLTESISSIYFKACHSK